MRPVKLNRSFLGAAFGTLIEYYDYAVLGTFLPIISPLFFQADNTYDALIKGYYALLIAMIARPIGGLCFGFIGDRFGRRQALVLSMYGIAIATLIIGLTPTYHHIGLWAAIILVTAKAIQIFCFGGEYNGAGIYVVEHAHHKNESFTSSLLTAFTLGGGLLATLVGVMVTVQGMPEWSWRIAFLFGGVMGIIGILYRKNLAESPNFKKAEPHKHNLITMIRTYPYQLTAGIFIGGFATIPFSTVTLFINPVLMTKGYIDNHQLMWMQSYIVLFAIIVLLISGKIADRKSPIWMMKGAALLLVVTAFPVLMAIDSENFQLILFGEMILILANEALLGPANALLKNLFPMQYRYRAASFSFTLGMSVLGGITPLVENFLFKKNGQFSGIAFWLIATGLCTFFSLHLATSNQLRLLTTHKKRRLALDSNGS